jgi:hypothetical protein
MRGFAREGWRTNFTNYRFAIPDWAGRVGKAIYNDVDQIYVEDPAKLFDLDLGDHGYLSVSAADTSVMLLDCSRMAEWWNLERAAATDKATLLADASSQPDLWGALDPAWNARDLEYDPATSRCVHFTLLHTQPWMPSPDQYSYHPHPFGDVWLSLEEEADATGYRPFGQDRPSARFHAAVEGGRHVASKSVVTEGADRRLIDFVNHHGAQSLLAYSLDVDRANRIARTTTAATRVCTVPASGVWPCQACDAAIVVNLRADLPAAGRAVRHNWR